MQQTLKRHFAATTAEIPVGGRKIVEIEGRSIGIFNIEGKYFALKNSCPHQFAPLCLGRVTGTTAPCPAGEYNWEQEGEIIRCPWHAWEFSILTGRSVFNPHKVRVKSYPVSVESGDDSEGTSTEEDETVETYPVTTLNGKIIVHL